MQMAEGRWGCHHGARLFDEHPRLARRSGNPRVAVDQQGAAQLFVQTLDGQVR
jgi:hypothetical protein